MHPLLVLPPQFSSFVYFVASLNASLCGRETMVPHNDLSHIPVSCFLSPILSHFPFSLSLVSLFPVHPEKGCRTARLCIRSNMHPATQTTGDSVPSFPEDFIILSEFSEQEGPVPVIIIPGYDSLGGFDVSNFVLRIMAVDYHHKVGNTPQNLGVLGGDTSVVLSERGEAAHAYVRHFTLHDLYARGYIRQACLSYVTDDRRKIMDNFNDIAREFGKVSSILRDGNRVSFLRELEDRVQTLKLKRDDAASKFQPLNNEHLSYSSQHIGALSPGTINDILAELEEIGRRIRSSIGLVSVEEETHDNEEVRETRTPSPVREEREPAPLWNDQQTVTQQPTHDESQRLISLCLHKEHKNRRTPRHIQELCEAKSYTEALELLRDVQRHFHKSNVELFQEKEDSLTRYPLSSLLTIGSVPVANFSVDSLRRGTSVVAMISDVPSSRSDQTEEETMTAETPFAQQRHMGTSYIPADLLGTNMDNTAHKLFRQPEWSMDGHTPGGGLMEYCEQYKFSRHLVYSLLKGRPTIIIGHDPSLVRKLVYAFSLFVPGLTRKVIPWKTTPIHVSDLGAVKLVGLLNSRATAIHHPVDKHVTIFDVDAEILRCPRYGRGEFVTRLIAPGRRWPSEDTFLAHIRYVLLDIGLKACLYYHLRYMGNRVHRRGGESNSISFFSFPPPSMPSPGRIHSPTGDTGDFRDPPCTTPADSLRSLDETEQESLGPLPEFTNAKGTDEIDGAPRMKHRPSVPTSSIAIPVWKSDQRTKSDASGSWCSSTGGFLGASPGSGGLQHLSSFSYGHNAGPMHLRELLRLVGARDHDGEIIEHIAEVVNEQLSMEALERAQGDVRVSPTFHLDFAPACIFRNTE